MRNIKLVVEYDGTDFHGFAIQRKLRTVQGELEKAVAKVTEAKTRVVGSGRTDAGAHALGQVVSFKTESRLSPRDLLRALNANLPDDLVVKEVEEVQEGFNARRSAVRRHYRYSLWNAELPSVWVRRYRYHVSERLDLEAMNKAAGYLVGTHDFAYFTQGLSQYLASGSRRTTIRTLFEAGWSGDPPMLDFDVVGTAFLPHMIRNMVGSMLRVGTGKIAPEDLVESLDGKSTRLTPWTVPAHGLMLVAVEY
ncbi:MAG: tRNA pseudouridine(38-40) synthase TruA [Chloroflexota bacterium]